MGRQKGQSQRTKGNVRPSSSSKAATKSQKFVGFESLSGELGYVPMLKSLEDDKEVAIDPDFRVAFSKLGKKDATTKVKALTELADLCCAKPIKDITAILVYWPRLYNRLCDDNDRKVRESCQLAFTSMVKSVGKAIAPYLKAVMGWWWISQSDAHAPTASAAKAAFAAAFPTNEKQQKALAFCSESIIHCISTNLFANSQLQVSTSDSSDEREKYRQLSASLSALAVYLELIVVEEMHTSTEKGLQDIYSNTKFWKFSKHQSPAVKASFYFLISNYCHYIPNLVSSQIATTAKSVLHKLNESNPQVSKCIWEAANCFTDAFDNWHEAVDIRKGFLPQLWGMIKNGFHGNAKVTSFHIAPLVGRFPPSLSVLPVYEELFKCLTIALQSERVLKSFIETKAIIECTIECVQVILQPIMELSSEIDLKLIGLLWTQTLIPLLTFSIEQPTKRFSSSFFKVFARFLSTWFLKIEVLSVKCSDVLEVSSIVWKDILQMGYDAMTKSQESDESRSLFMSYLNLLNEIQNALNVHKESISPKMSKGIKFSDDYSNGGNESLFTSDTSSSLLGNHLQQCLKSCIDYTLAANANDMWKVFALSNLLEKFASVPLFESCAHGSTEGESVNFFLEKYVSPLANTISFQACTREECCQVSSMFFHTLHHCDSSNAEIHIAEAFQNLDKCNGQRASILLALKILDDEKLISNSNACAWLTDFVFERAKELLDEKDPMINDKWDLVLSAISHQNVLLTGYVLTILNVLNSYLLEHKTIDIVKKVLKIYSVCFSTHIETMKEKDNFQPALHALVQLIYDDATEELMLCLKNTISSLLKAYSDSNRAETKTFVMNICCRYASVLCRLYFERRCCLNSSNGYKKAVVVIAETFVEHHIAPSFITKWLDFVLPSSDQLFSLRSAIDNATWKLTFSTHGGLDCGIPSEVLEENYFTAVKTFVNVANEMTNIFSETFKSLTLHGQYLILFQESLLAQYIANSQGSELGTISDVATDSLPLIVTELVRKSISNGYSWTALLAQFFRWIPDNHWNDDLFMDSIDFKDACLSAFLSETLMLFIKRSSSPFHLHAILQWCMRKFAENSKLHESAENSENHLEAAEFVGVIEFFPLLFPLLVTLFERLKSLQESKSTTDVEGEDFSTHCFNILEKVSEWKSLLSDLYLFDVDLVEADRSHLFFNSTLIMFLRCAIDCCPFLLTAKIWDFIECSFASWMESCCNTFKSKSSQPTYDETTLLYNVCKLMLSLEHFITSPAAISDPLIPVSLNSEWDEFFKPAAHASLVYVYLALADSSSTDERLLHIVGECLSTISSSALLSAADSLETRLLPGSTLPNNIQTVLHHFSASLLPRTVAEISARQLVSFSLLKKVMEMVFTKVDDVDCVEPPLQLIKLIEKLSPEIENLIVLIHSKTTIRNPRRSYSDSSDENSSSESEKGEDDLLFDDEPIENIFSESCHLFAYLLVWQLLIPVSNMASDVKVQYVGSFARNSSVNIPDVLSKIISFLPQFPYIVVPTESEKTRRSMFEKDPNFSVAASSNLLKIQHLACSVYRDILIHFPVYARTWFNGLSKTDSSYASDYTCKHVTPVICKGEMESVSRCKTPPGLGVRACLVAREVLAMYEISDAQFRISLKLPANFPLSPVRVDTVCNHGVVATQWRYWILQMTMLLQQRNGSIVDALLFWKEKVDKKLEGVEECMICFSVVHGSNSQSLPKLQCKTCRKKYHAECLFKWFDTSNQSTCPLCRSPMVFR